MTVIAGNWTTGDKRNLKTQAVARAGTFALSGVTLGDNAREFLEDVGGGKCFMFVIIALQRH